MRARSIQFSNEPSLRNNTCFYPFSSTFIIQQQNKAAEIRKQMRNILKERAQCNQQLLN
jgi:hypothetical protein